MLRGLLGLGSIAAWVVHIIAWMGGCLGSGKPKLTPSYRETLKARSDHIRKPSKLTFTEDFWTTSPPGMDNSALQSHGSISSTSTLTQLYDAHGIGSSSKSSEFVNHGLILWNQTRQKWTENKRPENQSPQLLEPKLSWNSTYDSLLGSNKPFRNPIPLGEMVDFLVDIWEQEGMYE